MSEMNENKTFSCAVARDLMPLYVENLTEEETTQKMREHISECAACAQSYGMQKTKLEIEKQPKRPDFSAIRYFKKSYLKRVALWMAVAIMAFVMAVGGYGYLFGNYIIDSDLVRVVGQYQLSNNRIVIALQVEDYCVNELSFEVNEWEDHSAYEYSNGYRVMKTDDGVQINANGNFVTNRFKVWTRKADERGDVFYYMFDPAAQSSDSDLVPFATPMPTAMITDGQQTEQQGEKNMPVLQYLQLNGKRLWKAGDPLRQLSASEEEVLLRAMEKAGALESSVLLPEVDIIDTLMGK